MTGFGVCDILCGISVQRLRCAMEKKAFVVGPVLALLETGGVGVS